MKIFYVLMPLLLFFPGLGRAAEQTQTLTIKLYKVPDNTPPGARLHAAGTFNNWNPGDNGAVFQPDADGILSLTLTLAPPSRAIAFKITRGSWASVERDEDGRDVPNHERMLAGGSTTVALKISSWADEDVPQGPTWVGHGTIVERSIPVLGETRRIRVHLPPDYERTQKSYPVLYMYDAQNLFDRRTAAFGQEWSVDESLDELFYEENFPGVIVVALDNSNRRGCEYNVFPEDPHPYCRDGSALGRQLNDFMAQDLKPWVDRTWRTRPERLATFVMGSSMGGQMALDLGLRYPQIFSRVFALSPSYQNEGDHPLRMPEWIRAAGIQPTVSVYQDIGSAEQIRDLPATRLIQNMRAVQEALSEQGFSPGQNEAWIIPGAVHNELAWAARFKNLVRRLSDPR